MKLASYRDGSRDGQLVVVSRDLALAHYASGVATRLQTVLDDWNFLSPQLEELSQTLNHGKARHAFAFDPKRCMAPLPRAYQWAEGSADLPCATVLQIVHRASDELHGAHDPIGAASAEHGVDFGAGLAVVTGDVPLGCTADAALESIRLMMLANDVTLHALGQAKPATAFGPVAVTLDELGTAWRDGRVHLPLDVSWNGRRVGRGNAGADMQFHFGELIAHLAATRRVRAGSIVGSGTLEAIERPGAASATAYMQAGDTVRIEMLGADGASVFGAIEQRVVIAAP